MTQEGYKSLAQISREYRISGDYLRILISRGKLHGMKLGRNWVTTDGWMEEYLKSANEWKHFLQTNGVPGARKKNEKTVFIKKVFISVADENISAPTPPATLAIEMSPLKEGLVEKYFAPQQTKDFVSRPDIRVAVHHDESRALRSEQTNEKVVQGIFSHVRPSASEEVLRSADPNVPVTKGDNFFSEETVSKSCPQNDELPEVFSKKIFVITPSDDTAKANECFPPERSYGATRFSEPAHSKFSGLRSASRDRAILAYAFAVLFGFFFTSEIFSDFARTRRVFPGIEDAVSIARDISSSAHGAAAMLADNFVEVFSRDINFSRIATHAEKAQSASPRSLGDEERYALLTPFGNAMLERVSSLFSGTQRVLIGFRDYITELLSPSDRIFVFKAKRPAEKAPIFVVTEGSSEYLRGARDTASTEEKREGKTIIVQQSAVSASSDQPIEMIVREAVIPADLTAFQDEFQRNLDNLDRRTVLSLKQLTEQMLSVAVKANQSYVRTGDAVQMIAISQDIDRLSNLTVSGTLRTENLVISGECSGCGSGGVSSGIAGSLSFYASSGTNVSGTANGLLAWDDANARLGIGTTSPYAKLSVAGSIVGEYITATSTIATSTFAGGIQASIFHATSTTASSTFANGINLKNGCFSINGVCAGTGNGTINAGTINTLPYYSSGTTLDSAVFLSITTNNSGLFGIGTSTPWSKLSVTGTAGTTSPIFTIASSTNQTYFTIGYDGNVGIGTTSPYAKLSVVGEVVGAYFTGTTTATSTLTGGLLTNDIRVSTGGLTIAGGSLVS
ncbi:MAG: hypothetical protein AAB950_00490, partial [Patescibacteria group bacterium]